MTRTPLAPVLLALVLGVPAAAGPAEAQTGDPQAGEPETAAPPAPPPVWRLGLRLGAFDMTQSSDSYDAVYGDTMLQYGVALEVELRRRWLVELTWDNGEVDGEQVLPSRPPLPTGVDTTLTYRPLALTGAYVLTPDSRWRWHLGAGVTLLDFSDEGLTRRSDGSETGYHAVAGVRRPLRRWTAGGELRYSTIPDAVGDVGITELFGEDDLGGIALHFVALYRLQ